jgi:hypothetical protein
MTSIKKLDAICTSKWLPQRKNKITCDRLTFISSRIKVTLLFFSSSSIVQFFARGVLNRIYVNILSEQEKNRITQADWCMCMYICYVVFIVFSCMIATSSIAHCSHHINKHIHLFSFFVLFSKFGFNRVQKKKPEGTNFSFFLRLFLLFFFSLHDVCFRSTSPSLCHLNDIYLHLITFFSCVSIQTLTWKKHIRIEEKKERCLVFLGRKSINCYHHQENGLFEIM